MKNFTRIVFGFVAVISVVALVFGIIAFAGVGNTNSDAKHTEDRVLTIEQEISMLENRGLLTEDEAQALINAAVAGKLDEAQVNDLIYNAISGKLSELLGTDAGIQFEDVCWINSPRYINVGFKFDWAALGHVDLISVTVYSGDDVIGKASTTGLKLAIALILNEEDYDTIVENGQLTCPVGLSTDTYWKQGEFMARFCTFTKIEIQITANHKVFPTAVLEKTETLHDYDAGVVTPPTCTEQGYTTYTCGYCEDEIVTDVVEALGHDFSIAVNTVDPTCRHDIGGAQQGYTTYECANGCGETEDRDFVPAYENYKPGCAECLAEKKIAACAEFNEFCNPILQGYLDINDTANLAALSALADLYKTGIENATTLNSVDRILANGKEAFIRLHNYIQGI
jgi:hypothetical protein